MAYTLIKYYPIDFKVSSYFITPEEAIKQIYNAGYRSVRVFLHSTGEEYKNNQFEHLTQEPCLWYLCEV